MLHQLRRVPAAVCLVALVACHDASPPPPYQAAATIAQPAFFDADLIAPAPAPAPRVALPGAVTSVDRAGAARFVWTRDAAPAAADLAITPALRARGATTPAAVAALWHAAHHAARWQLDPDALALAYVAHVHDLGHGAIVVQLRQRVGGIEVVHTSLSLILDRDLRLIGLSGALRAAARPTTTLLAATPTLAATDAVGRAFADAGIPEPALAPLPDRAGWRLLASPDLPMPVRARLVYYPLGDALVLAWETELGARDAQRRITGVHHIVAADDGRLLARGSLTAAESAGFTYRVWADATGDLRPQDGPQGDFTPHPTGVPDGFVPAFVAPSDVTVDGLDHAPGGGHDPWLAPTATTLTGNNVVAYADRDAIDGLSAGDVQATLTGSAAFARTFDVTQSPVATPAQSMAAITNQFYVTNWLHDYWYDSGFTEAAGNAQTANFGRGGVGGDPLHAEGQDASGFDNSDMTTPADGASPRMQMYLFHAPAGDPLRDGTIDNQVIEHEWMHYMHHRLVTTCDADQCAGMSEGWADFDALLTGARAPDDLDGTYGMGGYVSLEFTPDAAYYGIRRYPYSTNLAKSPLTLRFVQDGTPLPAGIPNNDDGGDDYEVHSIGEIWCAMLWEGLVAELHESAGASPRFTFEEARRRFSEYVVAGMESAPPEPTFTEQRDAILAVVAASDPVDFELLARAFAVRGFGTGAISPPVGSSTGAGVVEDFSVTGSLSVESATIAEAEPSCDHDGILDVGETGAVTVTVRNVGAATLAGPTVTIAPQTPGLRVVGSASATLGAIPPFATATATLAVALDEQAVDPTTVAIAVSLDDPSAAIAHVARVTSSPANLDVAPVASATDDFATPILAWTASAGWALHVPSGADAQTVGVAVTAGGDLRLTSPALTVGAGQDLVVSLAQRYALAAGADGGVLEVSTDGITFVDAATIAGVRVPYTGTIAGAGNVLAGRPAWTGTNRAFPGFDAFIIDLGTGFGGETVTLRFRAGGDAVADASSWDLAEVAISGITNTPFPALVPETGDCLAGHRPVADAGDPVTVASGSGAALDGSRSSDADGDALTYQWSQVAGATVSLSAADSIAPTFTASVTAADLTLRFQLVVSASNGRISAPAQVTVDVTGTGSGSGSGPVDAGPAPRDATDLRDSPVADAPRALVPDAGGPGEVGVGGGGCAVTDSGGGILLLAAVLLATGRRGRPRPCPRSGRRAGRCARGPRGRRRR